MRARRRLAELARTLAAILVVFAAGEALLRVAYALRNAAVDAVVLPYNAAQDFGPMPPWMDDMRLLEPDDVLFWRNRRGVHRRYLDVYSPVDREDDRAALLRRFLPGVPASLAANPVWEVSLDSRGFRGEEFATEKPPGTFRIACLGDSWTFGANVDQDDAYPQRLATLLAAAFPGARFEVLNLGTFAYTSLQGLELLRREVLDLSPDLLLIGFGMNDASIAGYRDKDLPRYADAPAPLGKRVRTALEGIEVYALLRYVVERLRHESWSIGDYMRKLADAAGTSAEAWIGGKGTEVADYEALEPYTRVSPPDFEHNIREMLRLARESDAGVVLLYNELWSTPYRAVLARISTEEGVPLVDSQALIARAKSRLERDLEADLGLVPRPAPAPTGSEVEVILRVYAGGYDVPKALFVAGTHPALGNGVPNRVALRDDGGGGDQRAGDHVWSRAIDLEPGTRVFYVYTNSGREGRWEGVDVPEIRRFRVPADASGRVFRPIESFGRIYLQADGWHPNAAGYEIIARAVFDALFGNDAVRAHVAQSR